LFHRRHPKGFLGSSKNALGIFRHPAAYRRKELAVAHGHVDGPKLDDLVLYVAPRIEQGDCLGQSRSRLIILVWLSDFEAFRRFGRSITGVRYVAGEFGPVPVGEPPALRLTEQRPTRRERFTSEELAVVDELLDRYRGWTAEQLADLAREFPGYRITGRGGAVPYETVYMSAQGPTEDDVARAQEVAREFCWT
jgi:hypothetical protein